VSNTNEHPLWERDNASVYCHTCKVTVAAFARGVFEHWYQDSFGSRYILLESACCSNPFVALRVTPGQDEHGVETLGVWSLPEQLFPPVEEQLGIMVPSDIADAYRQATQVFKIPSYDAAAFMCRKTIELTCKFFGATRGNLKTKLEDLRGGGIIDDRIHSWSDQILREIGNEAAHEGPVSKEDAADALEFCKAILDYLFVFMPAFNAFKARHPPKP